MISLKKSLPAVDIYKSNSKISVLDSDELGYGSRTNTGEKDSYAQKLAARGLSFEEMEMIYVANVWVRSAVDRIVERVSGVQPLIKPLGLKIEDYQDGKVPDSVKRDMDAIGELIIRPNDNNETFTDIRKKYSRDLLKFDASAIEIVTDMDINRSKNKARLYNVSGDQVKVNVDNNGMIKNYKQVKRNMQVVATWSKSEMIYGMLNPQSNKVYGLSPAESLIQTVTAELYASQYQLDFYYNNATPRFAVMMEGLGIGQGSTAMNRFRKWWDDELRGNPHRPIILGTENGKISFQQVGLSNQDMEFQQYSIWLLNKICSVYKIMPSLIVSLPSLQNKGEYKDMNDQFNLEAIKPHLSLFAEQVNQQIIFSEDVMGIKSAYLDFDLVIGDKKEQAEIHERYARMGVLTINDIRTRGLGLAPVPWGNVPYLQNNLAPFGAGKNGQVLPGNLDEANQQLNDGISVDDISNVPNTSIASKKIIEQYLSKTNKPIGWENLEVNERLFIVEKLLKEKEDWLSKVYIY